MDEDTKIWNNLPHKDLWIYDKLILSKKLGYVCGPVGVDVPVPNYYIVRPITNLLGMGRGAEKVWVEKSTNNLPVGYFWCEIFEGRHLTVDFHYGTQTLCVEGTRDKNDPLYKWKKWKVVDDKVDYPNVLECQYPFINIEMIGGKIIEIHLRQNPDFKHGGKEWHPVWKGDSTEPPEDMRFVRDSDYERVGFFIKD